ncbi:MAG TPA: serine/threonine-protein kinase, partial [bacterium]
MSDLTQIGHYVIKGLLRHGRSADSYFAENASMRSQKVLLRVLLPETASDPAFVRSFMEEARIAARLDHNCIASVLDLKDDGERIYAVLEFIEGLELGEILERFGPPPPEVAAAIMREVCSALEHAHGKSILHRRLRPRLIKVTPEGGVKVLGFGLRERESFLQSSVLPDALREELYRPPEQVREEPQDVRGDLYTLAVIIYELLSNRLPFDVIPGPAGRGPARKPPSIFERNPLVPAAFGRLLERCLAERREDRPADAGEVRRALDDLLDEYRVMHSADLLQLYLGNPPDYSEQARKRSLEAMLRDAERLSKGSDAERRAAIEELERLLSADPNHKQAASLARKLRPGGGASVPPPPPPPPAPQEEFDAGKTMLDVPGASLPPRPAKPASAPP